MWMSMITEKKTCCSFQKKIGQNCISVSVFVLSVWKAILTWILFKDPVQLFILDSVLRVCRIRRRSVPFKDIFIAQSNLECFHSFLLGTKADAGLTWIKGRDWTKTNLTKRPKKTAMTAWTMVITTVNFTWAALWPMMILGSLSHRYQVTTGLALGKSRDGEGSAYFIGSEDTKTVENRPLLTTSIDSPDIPRHRWYKVVVQAVIMFVGKLNENKPKNYDIGTW